MTQSLIQTNQDLEQEAQNYLPHASEYYYDQYSRNDESKFILVKNSWKSIKQNNSSGKYLTDKELEYVALMNGFLKNARYGVEYFTLEFLCSELGITDRQLRTIRTNTSHIFKTKWRKSPRTHKGRLKNVYAIRPTEHTVFLLGETNYYKSKYNSFVNNSVKSVKLGSQLPSSYNKDEKNINIRSRAKFANVKNSNSQNSSTELEETNLGVANGESVNSQTNQQATQCVDTPQESQALETTSSTVATVTPILTKSSRPSNKRRTRTNAEQKQRKAANVSGTNPAPNVVRNGFLGGGKRLSEIQPYLTDELCEKLRSDSGRDFTNRAIRQITKSIAVSDRGRQAIFQHINGVVAYLTPALANEKRDAVKTSGENYYTKAGMSTEDKLWQQQEKYLEETEQISIKQPCPEHQFRAKLANTLEPHTAYNLLLAMQSTSESDNALVLHLNQGIELTEQQTGVILSQAQAVFNSGDFENGKAIERVEFVVNASNCQSKASSTSPANSNVKPQVQLPKSKWGKVCSLFISQQEHGESHYQNWLAGLEVKENAEAGTIELRTSSGMVRDRIEQNYMPFLSKVAVEFGVEKVEFVK